MVTVILPRTYHKLEENRKKKSHVRRGTPGLDQVTHESQNTFNIPRI